MIIELNNTGSYKIKSPKYITIIYHLVGFVNSFRVYLKIKNSGHN